MSKISDIAPQRSSSLQVSGREQITNNGKVNIRLEEFVLYFVEIFEATLYAYHLILEGEAKEEGSGTFSGKLGQAGGGVLGLIFGTPAAGAKIGSNVGDKFGNWLGNKNQKKKVIDLFDMINRSQKDEEYFRSELIEAGFDIFQSFEMQFMRVTTEQGEKKAMQLLAKDAVNRAINYYRQKNDVSIAKGLLLGESKIEPVLGIPIPSQKITTPGFIINYKYKSCDEKWYTASLYEKVGLVIYEKTPRERTSYYQEKDKKTKTDKYGYRRLLKSESWDKLKNQYITSNVVNSGQFVDYQYILNAKDLNQKSSCILKKIHAGDESLSIKKIIEEVRDDIPNLISILKKEVDEHEEVHRILTKIELNLEKLEIDKYLKKFETYFENTRGKLEAGQEETRENFNKLDKKLETAQEQIKESNKMIRDIHEIVVIKKESIWFNVRGSVKFFIGREKELITVHNALRSEGGQVVISQTTAVTGLGGIGKSELARQYAHDRRQYYNGNVIWIDAETIESLKQSFQDVAEKLIIPIKKTYEGKDGEKEDRDIQSIVNDVYDYFKDTKSLFIFDNVEEYRHINEFVPTALSPDNEKPYILITSRNQDWDAGTEGSIKVVELSDFSPAEAEEFIKKALDIKEEDESLDEEIEILARELQWFPLALQQATAHIKEKSATLKRRGKNEFGINDYLAEYEKESKTDLLNFKSKDVSYRYIKTVFTTWKITLDNIQLKDSGKEAIDILDIIAYVSPDKISIERLFLKLVGDEEKLWSAIELLKRYSMINLEEGVSRIHRLVQEVIRIQLANQNKEVNVLVRALELIKGSTDATHIVSIWKFASKYTKLIDNFYFSSVYGENKSTPLHLLAENGGDKVIDNILKRTNKRGIDSKDIYNRTPLYRAVESSDIKVVTLLVNFGASIHYNGAFAPSWSATEWTVLHVAAYVGDKKIVNYLINKGADISCKDSMGRDSLYIAIYRGNEEAAKLLDKTGENTLSIYASLGKLARVEDILKDKSEEDRRRMTNPAQPGKCGPLHLAANNGHLSVVKLLVENGADISIFAKDGFTPLHMSASEGHQDVVDFLVKEAIKRSNGTFDILKMITKSGWTALHSAAKEGRTEILKLLIQECSNGKEESVREALVNAADMKRTSLLESAAFHGHLDTVKFLIENKANINAVDIFGVTPLFAAAVSNYYEVVEYLIKQENTNIHCDLEEVVGMLDINIVHAAAVYDNVELIKLVEKRLRINAGENCSFTPLHVAAFFDSQKVIKYLVDNGASPDAEIKFSNIVYVLNFVNGNFKGGYGSQFFHYILKFLNVFIICRLFYLIKSPKMISTIFKYNNPLVPRDSNGKPIQSIGSKAISLLVSLPAIERQLKMMKDYVLSKKREEPVPPVGRESIFYDLTNDAS